MPNPRGFLEIQRLKAPARPVVERVRDWREVWLPYRGGDLRAQATRCMDCGIPFCHSGCPLENVVPDWNAAVSRDRWRTAFDRLNATNNFPEFTGRLCPAPCEGSCVLGLNDEAVTIRSIELAIIERAFVEGWITPQPPSIRTGKRVAIVGSGPAGLAAADQLNRAGHHVTVFERADRPGGLLRYGIPEFKMEKRVLDRRLAIMAAEGIEFRPLTDVGVDITLTDVRRAFDAVVLAGGARQARNLEAAGRELAGVHVAMDYLTQQNRLCAGDAIPRDRFITAQGKRVAIIGGGDTGADCLGTALRQGARAVYQLELLPKPPLERAADNPWPQWPQIFRASSAHEEGGVRLYAVSTVRFSGDARGHVRRLHAVRVETAREQGRPVSRPIPGSEFDLDVELVLLAMGFVGAERGPLVTELGLRMTDRGTVWSDDRCMTSVPGVFVAGDMERGQSLIVWAMARGRCAASNVDQYITALTRCRPQRRNSEVDCLDPSRPPGVRQRRGRDRAAG